MGFHVLILAKETGTDLVLEQDHLGILAGGVILAADIGFNDTRVIGAKYSEEIVDTSLS